ncbi:MAG: glutathione peroxidase [Chitinophagales bacterium]|nr:glutathione peroxidase [Chitinophagales bacterium]
MERSIHQFTVKNLAGKDVPLEKYKGKALLIVNTASKCGYTPQYAQLEKLREKYKDKGFEILGFPSNDFGGQEPLEGEAIQEFCEVNYGVTFPVFEKVHVKGSKVAPLFKFLSDKKLNGEVSSVPKWNFHKYLIDKEGRVVDFFYTITNPDAPRLSRAIEKLL